ncbi:Protein kinase domain [Macleaya cordata]|uniref:Protein kinase domain n=1 Tax=Macleaya cordata TaxID=56857 RepID=A0A200QUE9_MACCD|nr:Protein kinase domain [Macleaya cordata]
MMRLVSSFQILWFFYGVLFVGCDSFPSNEILALTAFKEAIYDDPLMVLSNWNFLDADPCNWSGISCSETHDHVITLNLSSLSLRGFLAPSLSQLSSLQELILHKNNLLGTIPKGIGMLKSLKVLDLGMNQLSGSIPPEIGNLTNITKINLQSNGLIGSLPPELGNLRNLVELLLDRNKLQGNVPGSSNSSSTSNMHGMYASHGNSTGFCRSTQLKTADFSYNFFVGKIPQCLEYLPRSSFQGNCFQATNSKQRHALQCGASPPSESHEGSNLEHQHAKDRSKHQRESKPAWLLALEVVTGTIAAFILFFAVLAAVKKCKGKYSVIIPWKKAANENEQMTIYIDSDLLKDVVRLSRQELEVACEDFSNIIGSCPDTLVYKGIMKDGSEIAVISLCVKEEQWTCYLELYFQREVADLAKLNHENTEKLRGYCRESNPFSRMLVFEYASNGTLYEHLHYGEGCQLSWRRRMKIIIGIARGLRYLHTELELPFTISELNSSAVYLTDDFSPKLVDFERWNTVLARLEKNSGSIGNGGALCEFQESLEIFHQDVEDNIFAFGVLLLEIISGRPSYCKDRGHLVDWAKEYIGLSEVMSYLVDPELRHFKYDDLKVICEVVSLCIESDPTKRPSMQLLCPMLENGIQASKSVDLTESSLAWAELAIAS